MQPSSLVIYRAQHPKEILIALCAERYGCTISNHGLDKEEIPDNTHLVLLDDFWDKKTILSLYQKGISLTVIPGVEAFLATQQGRDIMGPWKDFTQRGESAWFAFLYLNTIALEERRKAVHQAIAKGTISEDLVCWGKIHHSKEIALAHSIAQQVILVQLPGVSYAIVSVGMAGSLVDSVHFALRSELVDYSLVHYLTRIDHENGGVKLCNHWSAKSIQEDKVLDDYFFDQVLGCRRWISKEGSPQVASEGKSMNKVLKKFSKLAPVV